MFHGVVSELLLPVLPMFSLLLSVSFFPADFSTPGSRRRGYDSVLTEHIPRFKIRGILSDSYRELMPYSSFPSPSFGNGIEMQIHGIG